MARRGRVVGRALGGQQPLGDARDPFGPEDEQQRQRDVEAQVEQHDFARLVELEGVDPAVDMRQGTEWRSRSRSA